MRRIALMATVVMLCGVGQASAFIIIGGDGYEPTSLMEDVAASFGPAPSSPLNPTLNSYLGFVRLDVSGTGQAAGTRFNDAFYLTDDQIHHPTWYQLAFDTNPILGSPSAPTTESQLAKNAIVYDVDAGTDVLPGTVPAYQASNNYSIVVDTGIPYIGSPGVLYFGVSNGVYEDNTGAYQIKVTQLGQIPEPNPIPEPTTFIVWSLIGLSAVGVRWRRSKT